MMHAETSSSRAERRIGALSVRWVVHGLVPVWCPGKYAWAVSSSRGPTLRELAVQALSSVEGGYDRLAPKFDRSPFRTPDGVLDATAGALRSLGPFGRGLDVCCGTGAGMRVLSRVCRGPAVGTDFSAGMLAQARTAHPGAVWVRADVRALPFAGAFDLAVSFGAFGHFLPAERPALFAGVHRALRPGGVFAFPAFELPPVTSRWYWALLGFDLAMRARNAVLRPPFVMYYRTWPLPAVVNDLTASGFTVTTVPLTALGQRRDGSPRYRLVLARRAGTPADRSEQAPQEDLAPRPVKTGEEDIPAPGAGQHELHSVTGKRDLLAPDRRLFPSADRSPAARHCERTIQFRAVSSPTTHYRSR